MTDTICGFFDLVGNLINSLLPTLNGTGTSQILSAVAFFVKLISAANYLFPVDTLFEVIGIVVSYKLFMMGLWVANWVIRTVRG